MDPVVPPRRTIVLKASRDTLVLVAAASGMTLALAYSVHTRPAAPAAQPLGEQVASAGQWAGQLAELQPASTNAPTEPLSSAALTIPKAAMALPAAPRPATSTRPKACEGPACAPTRLAALPPIRHPATAARPHRVREASLIETLNPLNHLPDAVKRPFASAGNTIAGWVHRF